MKEPKFGQMVPNISATGVMEKQKGMESSSIQTMIFMIANLKKIESTGMVYISIQTVRPTKVIGLTISNMAKEKKNIKTEVITKENLNMERKMDLEFKIGVTIQSIMVTGWTIISKEKVNTPGPTVVNIEDLGKIIGYTVKEFINMQMA